MARFEKEFSENSLFPKCWIRYVDDIFAVVRRSKIRQILQHINNTQWKTLQFTMEREENDEIPFLDLLIQRINNKIGLGVYHKPTSTNCYISADSYHHMSHKKAAFNSMVYRLVNLPLTKENYGIELNKIYEAALKNGYKKSLVTSLVVKFEKDKWKKDMTTLQPADEKEKRPFISLPYSNETVKLSNALKSIGFKVAFESGKSLQAYFTSTKDSIPVFNKSGIYSITCPECGDEYIGQTARRFITRFKEHQADFKKSALSTDLSAVAEHSAESGHIFNVVENAEVLEVVTKQYRMDAIESFYIQTRSPEMNKDNGKIPSTLYDKI